ncbi:hypothetical protein PVAP13_3NG080003 [Panicum virgatum]|uniref:Uncharacterized protein n=1 Tax=Panicum virgatum TaxID=38727 RepID=A0A8T0U197_PANVG|nr:hypothetical protein PVAP13_3NG080003 [Panicum virgatum]
MTPAPATRRHVGGRIHGGPAHQSHLLRTPPPRRCGHSRSGRQGDASSAWRLTTVPLTTATLSSASTADARGTRRPAARSAVCDYNLAARIVRRLRHHQLATAQLVHRLGIPHLHLAIALLQEIKEWEGTALVVMAMSAPTSTGVREVEEAILDEMRLHRGDVPPPRAAASSSTMASSSTSVRPWRSLEAALGAAMFFRVRLCLEGIPIVERLIGRSCALECIDTNLLQPDDTRTIDVWAWTPNPSRIPKCLWLVVTGRGDASSVTITNNPPAPWLKGAKFRVLIHLEWIHDYTSATTDHSGKGGISAAEPELRRLPWRRGAVDGEPAPQPERPWERHQRRDEHDDDGNPGAHGSRARSIHGAGNMGQEPVFRERDRSPPRRNWGSGHDGRRRDASPLAPINKLPTIRDLRAENDARLRFLFRAQAASMQDVTNNLLKNHSVRLAHDLVLPAMNDYITKALLLADKLGLDDEPILDPTFTTGNEALSGSSAVGAILGSGASAGPPLEPAPADVPVEAAFQRLKHSLQAVAADSPRAVTKEMVAEALDRMQAAVAQATMDLQLACDSLEQPAKPATAPSSPAGTGQLTEGANGNDDDGSGLNAFFTTPPPPAIKQGPEVLCQVQVRCRKTYDMSKDKRAPIEQVLVDYVNMYSGPLPQDIVAALSTFFCIHDEFAIQLDEVMLELAGIDDVQEVLNETDE